MFTQDFNPGPSMAGFKAFVESRNPEEYYPWMYSHSCACGQYAQSIGVKGWMFRYKDESSRDAIWTTMNLIAKGKGSDDWTFGRLAERLKEYA